MARAPVTRLHLSADRKVSPRGGWQESRQRWVPYSPNSFGLPSGTSCPGRTPFCVSCYAANVEKQQGVREALERNYRLLSSTDEDGMTELLVEMMAAWKAKSRRQRLTSEELLFRLHWDGDFFSLDYARAWARVMRVMPEVRFWVYTRSFIQPVDVLPVLAPVENLSLYLSVDRWNAADAARQVELWPQVRLALCGESEGTARALSDEPALRCPENSGRMPLMESGVGACVSCGICPDGRRDVIFVTGKAAR